MALRGLFVRGDRGTGTVVGIGLICALGVTLSLILAVGNVLICRSVARTAADHAALAASSALHDARGAPCSVAADTASDNHGRMLACTVSGEDVTVAVAVRSRVPFVGDVTASARAGPRDCG